MVARRSNRSREVRSTIESHRSRRTLLQWVKVSGLRKPNRSTKGFLVQGWDLQEVASVDTWHLFVVTTLERPRRAKVKVRAMEKRVKIDDEPRSQRHVSCGKDVHLRAACPNTM